MAENPFSPLPAGGNEGGGPPSGEPQPWEVGEVITEAWEKFKANAVPLVVATIGVFVATFIINFIVQLPIQLISVGVSAFAQRGDSDNAELIGALVTIPLAIIGGVIQFVVQIVGQMALTRLNITAARGAPVDLSQLTAGFGRIWTVIGAQLLMALALFGGLLLCIVPGYILGIGLAFAQFYAIDTQLGAVDCLKASWRAMDGNKLQVFGLGIVLGLGGLVLVLFTCGLGAMVVLPVVSLTMAIVYTRISGRTQDGMADPVLGGTESYA